MPAESKIKKLNFFQQLKLGYVNYWKGVLFLIKHKLYWYVVFPVVLFVGIYWLGYYFLSLEQSVHSNIEYGVAEINSLNSVIWRTSKIVFFDALHTIFTKSTLYIVIMILSPILAVLSEKIEEILTGNKYPWNLKQIMRDIKRGIKIAFRNLFWEYFLFAIVIGVGSLIGGTAKEIMILSIPMVIGFYFYGFSFLDYVNERRRLNIQQSIYFVSKHKGLAVAIGSVYSIFFLSYHLVFRQFETLATDTGTQLFWGTILVITFILATIAPIIAITSATLSMHEMVDLNNNRFALNQNPTEEGSKETEESQANQEESEIPESDN